MNQTFSPADVLFSCRGHGRYLIKPLVDHLSFFIWVLGMPQPSKDIIFRRRPGGDGREVGKPLWQRGLGAALRALGPHGPYTEFKSAHFSL